MKYLRMCIAGLFIGLLFSSCEFDVTDKYYTKDDQQGQLVVNCFFSPDRAWTLYLSKSYAIGSTPDNTTIDNAKVYVEDGQGDKTELSSIGDGIYYSKQKPKANQYYKLTVSAPGFAQVTAQDSTPPMLETKIAYDTLKQMAPGLSAQGDSYYRYVVTVANATVRKVNLLARQTQNEFSRKYYFSEENITLMQQHGLSQKSVDALKGIQNVRLTREEYYEWIRHKLDNTFKIVGWLSSGNYITEEAPDSIVFADGSDIPIYTASPKFTTVHNSDYQQLCKDLDAEEEQFPFFIYAYQQQRAVLPEQVPFTECEYSGEMELLSLTTTAYNYVYSALAQSETMESFLNETTAVKGNVVGGYGVFAGAQTIKMRLVPETREFTASYLSSEGVEQMVADGMPSLYADALEGIINTKYYGTSLLVENIWKTMRSYLGQDHQFDPFFEENYLGNYIIR